EEGGLLGHELVGLAHVADGVEGRGADDDGELGASAALDGAAGLLAAPDGDDLVDRVGEGPLDLLAAVEGGDADVLDDEVLDEGDVESAPGLGLLGELVLERVVDGGPGGEAE